MREVGGVGGRFYRFLGHAIWPPGCGRACIFVYAYVCILAYIGMFAYAQTRTHAWRLQWYVWTRIPLGGMRGFSWLHPENPISARANPLRTRIETLFLEFCWGSGTCVIGASYSSSEYQIGLLIPISSQTFACTCHVSRQLQIHTTTHGLIAPQFAGAGDAVHTGCVKTPLGPLLRGSVDVCFNSIWEKNRNGIKSSSEIRWLDTSNDVR